MRTFVRLLVLIILPVLWSASAADAQTVDKPFQRAEAAADALRLQAELARDADPAGRPAQDWLDDGVAAIRAGEWRDAATAFARAIAAAPQSERAWRNYAVATLRIEPQDWSERHDLPRRAVAAAYRSYLLAEGTAAEARALALLGDAYARRELFRPALDAYTASLDLVENPEIRATYDETRARHGFRMLDYTVESDAASPRVCVHFSEPLAEGRIDFSAYVSVAGIDRPAVSAEEFQLCIDGLEHGRDYRIALREGLPSSVGEDLPATAALSVYVRDRAASVRFTGRNYVLPSRGQSGIPLVSVNVDEVAASLYRVADRGVAPAVVSGDFQRQLSGSAFAELVATRATEVWSGTMPVASRLNEDVTTAFPVADAAGTLQPGVYVLVAGPAGSEPDYWDLRATQWFVVSDLGLSSVTAHDGVHLFVRSLAGAEPLAGVELELVSRGNEVLATAVSDEAGHAAFPGGLARGTGGAAPAVVVARNGGSDYAFLDLTQPAFDLTDRGVEGRAAPGPLDAFVVTERGVYRSGETVHVTALLRDAAADAVAGMPLTLIVERPDGAEDRRTVTGDLGDGGRTYDVPLIDGAMAGTWRVRAHVDPRADPIGETTFLVEDYVPERLELELDSDDETIAPDRPARVSVDGRWLYGAPAAGLAVEGEVTVRASDRAPPGLSGYRFGLSDEVFAPVREPLARARTDDAGTASVDVALPALPATTRALEAEVGVSLREPGGRGLRRVLRLPVAMPGPRIGVRPAFGERVGEGETAGFDVVAVDAAGETTALDGLNWELVRLERRFQWYQDGTSWRYETITTTTRVADGRIDVDGDAPQRVSAAVGWGEYRFEVTTDDPAGPATSITFEAGWAATAAADTPDMLALGLDRERYVPGETARLRLDSRFAGTASIVVVGETVESVLSAEIDAGGTEVDIPVEAGWGAGAYVVASLARPLDEGQSRMPGRAVGVTWLALDAAPRTLSVQLDAPARAAPRERFALPVRLDGLADGERAQVVVAAVDVGILNLTGYEPPAPGDWYFGQRALGAEIRDVYGQLIDGMRAERGRLRTGGDAAPGTLMGEPPAQAPLALFSGVVPVGPDGTAEIAFDLPAFNGTMRVMAMAWSADRLGEASADVVVADPVVVTASAPRFLAEGDTSRLRLDIHNVAGGPGDYRLLVDVDGPLSASGTGERVLSLDDGARATHEVGLEATGIGTAGISLALEAPDGSRIDQRLALPVNPAHPPVTRETAATLAAGARIEIGEETVGDFVPGTGRVTLSVGPLGGLDVAGRLAALDAYAYGCTEQVISRALPLLYLSDLDAAGALPGVDVAGRIAGSIARVLANQDSSGSFGLWSPGGGDLWLDAYATDFLTRARDEGHDVAPRAISTALDRLSNTLAYQTDIQPGEGADIAYAHYMLARNGRARLGDLRYIADARLAALATPLARAQIGAALAILGDGERAGRAFASARDYLDMPAAGQDGARRDFGSAVRDGAAILALAAETGEAARIVPAVAQRVEALAAGPRNWSTQENAWLVLAARGLRERAGALRLDVDGSAVQGPVSRTLGEHELAGGFSVANTGADDARVSVRVEGAPRVAEPAAERGFILERRYYALDGSQVEPDAVAQNDRLVVVLSVFEAEPQEARILLVDRLPAGFEIDNPRLVGAMDLEAFAWLSADNGPEHADFRDDRFVAAFDRRFQQDNSFSAAYVVRAVTPGDYALPPAMVEDMYRPDRFARTGSGRIGVVPAR